jgi:radical SAM superfamily enzyme YgiQ (UPF0313 family)
MEYKKVLLVDPPFQKFMNFSKAYSPLGLLYIAGELKRKEYEVYVYDADYHPHGESLPFITKMERYNQYLDALQNHNHPIWLESEKIIEEIKPDVVGLSLISTKLVSGLYLAEKFKKFGVKRIIAGGPHVSMHPEEVLDNPHIDAVVIGEGERVFEEAMQRDGLIRAERINDLDNLA